MLYPIIALSLIYLFLLARTIRFILLEKGTPSRTLAWIAFLFLIPVFGMLLYYIFGRHIRNKNIFQVQRQETQRIFAAFARLQKQHSQQRDESLLKSNRRFRKLIKLVMQNEQTVWTTGNRTQVFHDGPAFFDSMFEDMRNAKKYIAIQFYIFQEGKVADQMVDILKEKVIEGVKVQIIYDGFGSRHLSKQFVQELQEIGIELYSFIPFRLFKWPPRMNYRNHRKIVVIDGSIGYTGGFNIADKYMLGDPILGFWRDTHVRIEGPAALGIWLVFLLDWHFVSEKMIHLEPEMFTKGPDDGCPIQIIASGPDSDIANIQQQYFSIINLAKDYVYISTPYFIPDLSILNAIKTAALSGVDTRLMIPYNSDTKILKWSIRSYLEELLEVGVKVYFYKEGFIHCKVLIADDIVSSIGTANVDERSFSQNFEINAIIYDQKVCSELKDQFILDLESCEQIIQEDFRKRPRREKVYEAFARLFSPLI